MKVTYIGNFRHDFCTEVHVSKTLQNLGVEVQELQEDELNVYQLERLASSSEVLLYTRTWGVKDKPVMVDAFRSLEGSGTKTASYHLDLYLGIQRESTLSGDPFWMTEYVFTPDGDPISQDKFARKGINHFYIKPGVFKPECYAGDYDPNLASDVAFVGSVVGYHKEWPYRPTLHKTLARAYGSRYRKHGHPESTVRGKDLNNLYASAKVIVGDSLCPGFKKPYYWSDRVYETVGRGGFLIHPRIEGLEDEFTDGEHLRFYDFNDFNGLRAIIDEAIEDEAMRDRVSTTGMEYVRDNCTYNDRLRQAFAVMGFDI